MKSKSSDTIVGIKDNISKNKTFKLAGWLFLTGIVLLVGNAILQAEFGQKSQEMPVLQGNSAGTINATSTEIIKINGATVNAEVVDTDAAMEKGLGGRGGLNFGQGMWFIFTSDDFWGIWMKDMLFPINILWLRQAQTNADLTQTDADKKKNILIVTGIKENAAPDSYPQVFYPEENSRYVLEVPTGFVTKEKIKIHDQAEILSKGP